MVSFKQARKLVMEKAVTLGQEIIKLDGVFGRIVAEDIHSKNPVPPFRNSAVDGYAVRSLDIKGQIGQVRLKLVAKQPAGDYYGKKIGRNQTVKVMTGAPVPPAADAVVPVEEVEEKDGYVELKCQVKSGENIREAGEDVKRGQLIIKKGTWLRTPHLGLLAACGFGKVRVYRRPRVTVLVTGNELCRPGRTLRPGKIFDSNSTILKALLETSGAELVAIKKEKDNLKSLVEAIRTASNLGEIIITSGGISVGDFDLVNEAAKQIGGERVFWKVAQKPAKPLAFYYLKRGGKPVWIFGLPGNPGAVMISFEEYVRPFIKKIQGCSDFWPEEIEATLTKAVKKKKGRLNFLRVRLENQAGSWLATPLDKQESGMISSLTLTRGIALIPAEADYLAEGEKVIVHLIEW